MYLANCLETAGIVMLARAMSTAGIASISAAPRPAMRQGAAYDAWGCSLRCMGWQPGCVWLQPGMEQVAIRDAWGYSLAAWGGSLGAKGAGRLHAGTVGADDALGEELDG